MKVGAHFRGVSGAGLWLGFGLAMFVDGIVLHQILQWHHLLSGVAPDATAPDLRFQVLADGIFHLFTFGMTALGLGLLWANRRAFSQSAADGRLIGYALVGFGGWHILDAVVNHWLVGLHRIRMDADIPLLWDLLWVVPLGFGVAGLGFWLLGRPPSSRGGLRNVAPIALAFAVLTAGAIWSRPPVGAPDDRALVIFRPGMAFADIVAAAEAVGGRLVWTDRNEGLWLLALEPEARATTLYRHGALLVSSGPIAVGCLSWSRLVS